MSKSDDEAQLPPGLIIDVHQPERVARQVQRDCRRISVEMALFIEERVEIADAAAEELGVRIRCHQGSEGRAEHIFTEGGLGGVGGVDDVQHGEVAQERPGGRHRS